MTQIVALPGGRTASYEIIGSGRPALMFAGGPGFSAAYMNGDAWLLSDVLCSYLIDPHGSGSSTAPASPVGYSPEGHARFYEEVRQALALPGVVVLGHSFGATTALTYAALYPDSTASCVAVAAFGELDFICGPAQAHPIARAIIGSQLVMLAGCGHIPSIEAPREYRQAVVNFLGR
jgi:proline iminopeptidase